MNFEAGLIISIAGLCIIVGGLIAKLERRITALETKVEVFWKSVSLDVALLLHKPHTEYKRRDELIEKYIDDKLTTEELKEFIGVLEEIKKTSEEKQERFYASYLLSVIRARFSFI